MAINYHRALDLVRRLPLGAAISLVIAEGARALLNRHGRFTYSQTGEDILLHSLLDLARPGFYVDIGCNHPIKGSNTYALYSRGWRGLVVDGNDKLIEAFRRIRPRDAAVSAIVSNQVREMTFTLCHSRPELSSVSHAFESHWMKDSDVKERLRVQSVTLEALFIEHNVPKAFDILSIDCEGHDYEVLTSFSLDQFRPQIVVVEMHGYGPAMDSGARCPVKDYLCEHGYRQVAYTKMNGIFIDTR